MPGWAIASKSHPCAQTRSIAASLLQDASDFQGSQATTKAPVLRYKRAELEDMTKNQDLAIYCAIP